MAKSNLERQYDYNRDEKSQLGTGDYSDSQKTYWKTINEFYKNRRDDIKKSKNVIRVDFKKKKVISGVSRAVKNVVNSLY